VDITIHQCERLQRWRSERLNELTRGGGHTDEICNRVLGNEFSMWMANSFKRSIFTNPAHGVLTLNVMVLSYRTAQPITLVWIRSLRPATAPRRAVPSLRSPSPSRIKRCAAGDDDAYTMGEGTLLTVDTPGCWGTIL